MLNQKALRSSQYRQIGSIGSKCVDVGHDAGKAGFLLWVDLVNFWHSHSTSRRGAKPAKGCCCEGRVRIVYHEKHPLFSEAPTV